MTRSISLLLLICSSAAFAVEPLIETPADREPDIIDNTLSIFGADGGFDDSKTIDMSYLPTAFYTPEKKFGAGLLVIGLYKTQGATKQEQPSSLVINSFASSNGSYGVEFENMTFFNQGKHRLLFEIELHNESAVYYGQGIDAGNNDANKHEFDEQLYRFSPSFMTRMADNFFIGIGADISHAKADDLKHEPTNTPISSNRLLPSNTSTGVVISSSYDSRDYRLNASKGWLLKLDAGWYHNNEYSSFSTYNAEIANYIDLSGTAPGLIAWQVQGRFSDGDVPWNYLPDLGGSSAMRGYIKGRYRDEQMMMAQIEYRLPIYHRFGMVFWGAGGSVAPTISKLSDELLGSYGTGFRFNLKDNINLRFDVGVGKNDTNFYLNVNEVF